MIDNAVTFLLEDLGMGVEATFYTGCVCGSEAYRASLEMKKNLGKGISEKVKRDL